MRPDARIRTIEEAPELSARVGSANPLVARMRTILISSLFIAALGCKSGTAPFETDDSDPPSSDTDTDIPTDVPTPLTNPEQSGARGFTSVTDNIPTAEQVVPARIFIPDGELGPVAVILPGFLLDTEYYDSYAEHLASHGYVAVIMNLNTGIGQERRSHSQLAEDLGFVLNWFEGQAATRLEGIDPYNIYVSGHSLGGKVAMLRATTDQRIRAVVALDPLDTNPPNGQDDPVEYPSVTPELMSSLAIPLALIGENTNAEGCAPGVDNFEAYYASATGPALQVEALQANHMSWLDEPECGALCNVCSEGTDDPAVTKAMSRGIMLSFFEHTRSGRAGARDYFTTLPDHVGANRATVEFKGGL